MGEGRIPVLLDQLGGVATRGELIDAGGSPEMVDLFAWYRRILRTRRGLYVSVGTSPLVIRALKAGGRLACVSALAYHRDPVPTVGEARDMELHVLIERGVSRARAEEGEKIVFHWTRKRLEGSRVAVSEEVALAQAEACRGGTRARAEACRGGREAEGRG